ncbi:hypothetical protein [Streptomyces morookaense]|uniref:Uncharacterized protein n=1 Tax=Streptomyces morookaense TaxID=1970 RepID=A0A7Y7E7U7_STRMO|nr:hypothetical protein [Streptomyces morookaense]NVK78647.1 hypothetical protein [Streptomyces morookaense]GHF44444.1 hypothetical protein GCM10010359_53640 [Streptomyces morookaense]
MGQRDHGDAMPAHLRQAVLPCAVEVINLLEEVLRYCAPDRAEHGWARMCMYRSSDAMDTLGRLTGVIAAELVAGGRDPRGVQRLLRSDVERLRTSDLARVDGASYSSDDLEYIPQWLHEQVQRSVGHVLLRLNQVIVVGHQEKNPDWYRHCLYSLSEMMDELGCLNRAIAVVNADVLNRETLARYQHLFQQRSRRDMPDAEDFSYRAGLLGLLMPNKGSAWYVIGQSRARRRNDPKADSHEWRVLQMLAALDMALQGLRWMGADGRLLDSRRLPAVSYINALTAVEHDDDEEFPPLYWLPPEERAQAQRAMEKAFGAETVQAAQASIPSER